MESNLNKIARLAAGGQSSEALSAMKDVEGLCVEQVAASPFVAAAISKLAVEGGPKAAAAIWDALDSCGGVSPMRGFSGQERVTEAIFRVALERHSSGSAMGCYVVAEDALLVALSLPHAHAARREKLEKEFGQLVLRIVTAQERVLALHAKQTLPALLTRSQKNYLIECVGAIEAFNHLDVVVRLYAAAAGYPRLGEQALHRALTVSRWPITACLSHATEIIYGDVLARWYDDRTALGLLTDAGREWLRNAVQFTGEDYAGEPGEPWPDD